jgi:hypothetical protein
MNENGSHNVKLLTESHLDAAERYSQIKFKYRSEILDIMGQAEIGAMIKEFEELIFLGKFITNAHSILKRSGNETGETIKLASEYQKSIAKSIELLKLLIGSASDKSKKKFEESFFTTTHNSLHNILDLMYELSWIKNYSLDTHHTARIP